jgi:hypothetical protein
MRAFVSSRRTERRLEELMLYLGLTTASLGIEDEQVRSFHAAATDFLVNPGILAQTEIVEWAQKLLTITEEYLALVVRTTGDKDAWKMFTAVVLELAKQCSEGSTARMYVEHSRRNLRNASYFHIRDVKGTREADKTFPREGYTLRLARTFFPQQT